MTQTRVSPEASPRRASPTAILWVVGFAVFVAADDLTVVTTMLRPIINDLGLTLPDGLDDAAWIVNVYLIAFVSIMPLAGRLSDVIGRRMLFVLAYLVFLVGTIVIPLSSSMAPFLVGRVLTAIGGGAMVPVALAVVGDVFDEDKRARALGNLGAIETMGWVWGPLYGALLVRFLSWRWQFWLNIPLALIGLALAWWALEGVDEGRRERSERVDWTGAVLLALTLIALDLALLGNAEIQSVSGLEELQGGSGFDFRVLFPVAAVLGAVFVWHQRRADDPLIAPAFFRGRNLQIALFVNLLVGAALIIAMVDVPIFVNAIEIDLERSAVLAGWVLAAMTAAMAVSSWTGGRLAERMSYRPPTVLGMAAASGALLLMGLTWSPDLSYVFAAAQLALLGAGLGLVFAPTTATVVDASPPHQRGAAAAIVMIVRLIGLSVGLAGLTAWGLARFNELRQGLELPAITDPGFQEAITEASARLTADAISETFLAATAVTALGLLAAFFIRPDNAIRPSTPAQTATGAPAMNEHHTSENPGWLKTAVIMLGIGLLGALIALGFVVRSLNNTQDELVQTQADLIRVEEGAAGSAIVSAQVLEISRQITALEPEISAGFDEAITELEEFSNSTLEFQVAVDETVTIDTEITIDRDFSFPIDETISIDESLPINQTVDTTIEIDTGLGFEVPVDVSVPVNVDVPVQVDVPIDLDVDVPISETVPISAEVPIQIDIPVRVDIAETELKDLADQLALGLRNIQAVVDDLSG